MLPQPLRKAPGLVLAAILLILIMAFSIRKYDLLPDYKFEHDSALLEPVQTPQSTIPRKIWQIFSTPQDSTGKPPSSIDPKALGDATSWIGLNSGYQYKLLGGGSADDFVIKHFSHDKPIMETYFALRNPGLKTDLLRYLVLWVEGGVYGDLDTWALKPIDSWVPEHLQGHIRAVVGLEWDQLDGEPWPGFGDEPSYMTHVVQFCQWTLAAAPGHPLLGNAIQTSVKRISDLAAAHETSISDLNPIGYEVVTTTGPSAWTDVVFEQLKKADPTLQDLRELSNMKESRIFGDILVLTIDGFGMGQPHSHSTADGSIPDAALAKHGFRHSWLPNVS